MNILIVGSGGREHALAWKIAQSDMVKEIYVAPGNAGTAALAENIDIAADNIESLLNFAKEKEIDLTVVGPEVPLVLGIADIFAENNLLVFGPQKNAAQLEGSKVFSKLMMEKYGVPTASFKVFKNSQDAANYILSKEPPYVIKADGLAAGKGVIIAKTTSEAVEAVKDIIDNKKFGESGKQVLIEDCLLGDELSILAFADGENIIPLASSQDHKRAFDNDEGPNTGGMGAYSPCPLVSHDDLKVLVDKTITPLIKGLKEEGIVYRGLIYAGIMITADGPMVLEYNVRFGDPETQAVLPRLKDDIVPIMLAAAKGDLSHYKNLSWDYKSCITVVMASNGYPGSYEKGFVIEGLEYIDNAIVFHAGTALKNDKTVTSGGRILAVSALGENLADAINNVYKEISKIKIEKSFYRKDIGGRGKDYEKK